MALLRLVLVLLQTSGFRLSVARLPDGRDKLRILRAVDRACKYLPLRPLLRFLRVSPSRFHAWGRRQRACVLDDQLSASKGRIGYTDRSVPFSLRNHLGLAAQGPDGRFPPVVSGKGPPNSDERSTYEAIGSAA